MEAAGQRCQAAKCVGMVALTLLRQDRKRTLFIDELFVRPAFRRRGIGRWLLRHAAHVQRHVCE